MILGEIFGIRFRVNGLFILLLVLSVATGLLSETLVIFFILLTHEFAHILAANGCGGLVREVELYPFGGVARVEWPTGIDPTAEAIVSLAGPLNNLVLGALSWWAARFGICDTESLELFIQTNLAMGVLNLVPALPLDGGRALRGWLSVRRGYRSATVVACVTGRVIAVIFFIAAPILFFVFQIKGTGLSLLVCSLFIWSGASAEYKWASCAGLRATAQKKERLMNEGQMPVGQVVALAESSLGEVAKRFSPERYHVIMVVNSDMQVIGTITETGLFESMMENGYAAPLASALK